MATPDPLRDAIRDYLARTGQSERELSLKAGLNEKAVQQILSGRSQSPRGQTLARLSEVLEVPVAQLIALPPAVQQGAAGIEPRRRPKAREVEPSEDPSTVRVPELDVRPQGGGGGEMPVLDGNGNHAVVAQWSMPADYLRAFVSAPERVRIVRVAGDSMEPEYPAGERVAVDTSHTIPSPPGVYVLWDGFGLVLKRVEILMGSDPPRVRLSSVNPAYPPYERLLSEIMVNGRVIGKWTWR